MNDFEKRCKIERNEALGRYVVAAVDIKAGETVSVESPILILPCNGDKRCANCFKLADNYCKNCQVFPLCDDCTQHNDYDCKLFAEMKNLNISELQKYNQICGMLKCLVLQKNPETTQYYETLKQMEAHLEERRNTDIWKERDEKVIQPILNSGVVNNFNDDKTINADLLQQLYGAIDVNCFEIRAPDKDSMRGVYPQGALLAHNCCANTMYSIDENYQMKIIANQDIPLGEIIYNCYTNVLLGTDERRESLKIGKYFQCNCERCIDPTELGSHMSSLVCSACVTNKREGFLVKQENTWKCLTCDHTLKQENVDKIIERTKEEIFHARDDIYRYEMLLAKLGRFLHQNHYLMIDIKQNIAAILRAIIMNLAHKPGRKVYERKVRLCQEILTVLRVIQPGISRIKAIALYELCTSFAELSRMRFSEKDLDEPQLIELLQKSESMLRESLRMLFYEPVETPEGQLAKSMLKELKDLQNDIKMLQEKQEND